jgi:hypothetical protein
VARPRKTVVRVLAIAAIAALSLLAAAGSAIARTVPVYTYTGQYYDGTGSTAGTLAAPTDVDLNQTAEKGYVTDPVRLGGSVSQFDRDGNPLAFSALEGATAIDLNADSAQHVAVDNSSTSTKGNVYVLTEKVVKGYRPDGTELGGGFPLGGFQRVCDIATDAEGNLWVVDYPRYKFTEYNSNGELTGKTIPFKPFTTGLYNGFCSLTIDSHDNFYLDASGFNDPGATLVDYGKKYDSEGHVLSDFAGSNVSTISASADMTTDHVFTIESKPYEFGTAPVVIEYDENGEAITSFGTPDPAHSFLGLESPTAVAVSAGDQRVYVADQREYEGAKHIQIFEKTEEQVVPTVKTEPPALTTTTSATLEGTVDLDGLPEATECYFQWGEFGYYGQVAPCTPGSPITTPGVHQVTAQLEGLTQGTQYHYRLVVKNSSNEILAFGRDRPFRPQGELSMSETVVSDINSDGARISADVNPNGGETKYFVEYGQEDCDLSSCAVAPLEETFLPKVLGTQNASVVLTGLQSDTSYHYRLVAKNDFGEVAGAEDVFRTYVVESTVDTCPNALIRKETGTVLLPDCRAYELVSPANAGGYDVRSDLIPGQTPFAAKPRAADSVLYSLNFGKVPGVAGEPTNHGSDPYIARRTDSGWSTTYAGIAVGDPPFQGPFASTPLDESEDLSSLVFGGPEICSPCFADGKTGLPIRRDEGPLTQGMAGSLDPGPSAEPDGYIGRRLSADGTHLIFGSAAAFEQGAPTNGDVSIYDRNLVTGVTHVVSKEPGGAALSCLQGAGNCHGPGDGDGIAALDVSADGSRVIVAQRVETDSAGNRYWHPYMNIDDSPSTVDLAPGATDGVLYDGMSSDGSSVLFTTVDSLTADDHDESADIYRADVSAGGTVTLTRLSGGSGGGDTDLCNPAPADGRNNWNAPGAASENGCGAVAFAGGAGVARGSGAIYFLSPERLDGTSGAQDQPNLYLSMPGEPTRFVATLEPSNPAIDHAVLDSDMRGFGDFQVTPSGDFAAFSSGVALTGFPTAGHTAIYRYAAQGSSLVCASCPTTRATLNADTELSEYGLNLADDGRVFFTTTEPLALRDTGSSSDVYEWKKDRLYLISTGRSPTATGLLSVSADGRDAYFYTRDTLVSEDHNGKTVKIYTARENGGFATPPVVQECQASDECHGPGSAAPPAAALPTFQGTGGNAKPAHKKKKHRHRHRRGHRHKHRHHHKAQRRAR